MLKRSRAIVLCLCFCLFFTGLSLWAVEKKTSLKKAAQFTIKDSRGKKFNLDKELKKGPMVISFWATWCAPCLKELKIMKSYYKPYEKAGVQFIAISIDDHKTASKVPAVVKSHRLPYKILLDPNKHAFSRFQGRYPPLTIVIDQSGDILYYHIGYKKGEEKGLIKVLDQLIKDKNSST